MGGRTRIEIENGAGKAAGCGISTGNGSAEIWQRQGRSASGQDRRALAAGQPGSPPPRPTCCNRSSRPAMPSARGGGWDRPPHAAGSAAPDLAALSRQSQGPPREPDCPAGKGRRGASRFGPGATQGVGCLQAEPEPARCRLLLAPNSGKNGDHPGAARHGGTIDMLTLCGQRRDQRRHSLSGCADTQQRIELTRGKQHVGPRDETGDHRMAQGNWPESRAGECLWAARHRQTSARASAYPALPACAISPKCWRSAARSP